MGLQCNHQPSNGLNYNRLSIRKGIVAHTIFAQGHLRI